MLKLFLALITWGSAVIALFLPAAALAEKSSGDGNLAETKEDQTTSYQKGADPSTTNYTVTGPFASVFSNVLENDPTGQIRGILKEVPEPTDIHSLQGLLDYLDVSGSKSPTPRRPGQESQDKQNEQLAASIPSPLGANSLFSHFGFPLDPRCITEQKNWWYRTYDGSCNWLKLAETNHGASGTQKSRDYDQRYYADGISKPRDGPNARAVSNAFFKRHETVYFEHTPLLLGLIEFILHDVTWSQDSTTEFVDVDMPYDETEFSPNTTLRVWRTGAVPGTGTSIDNPRENANMATTWMDASPLYGNTEEVAKKLRSFQGGKLLSQNLTTRGRNASAQYLPLNTMNVPTRTRPGVDTNTLFAGGDPRTNEDWVMLTVHSLFLREHNRLCDILAEQNPTYDDEQLFQTVRLAISTKLQLIANSYQMAYWTDDMPWPRDDGYPLFRVLHGENFLKINPAVTYPWDLASKDGKPMTISAEMAVAYRFHDFIIPSLPIKDAGNNTLWDQDLFDTGFNSQGFIEAGLENVLRGILAIPIPNFHSGVDEAFRTAGKYRGAPFDIATWSVVHEREQGLPTFNQYFTAYNSQGPNVIVPIRTQFEDFSSDPAVVANLKRLYATPYDVDLVVGVQLDEEFFPGTTIPKSAAIVSLISLFGTGNSDRFSIAFAMMRCWLVDKPWDCHPSNALEDLVWKPMDVDGYPNFRWYDSFWLRELDIQAHGANLLWRLVTENTDIECLQQRPLFPVDPDTNPIVCEPPNQDPDPAGMAITGLEIALALLRQRGWELAGSGLAATMGSFFLKWWKEKERTSRS